MVVPTGKACAGYGANMAFLVIDKFIHKNKYTRCGKKIEKIKGVVVHWTGVPNQTADSVRRYFDYFAPKNETYASAHYIIDIDGTVLYIIPYKEVAYHVSSSHVPDDIKDKYGYPNESMIGIECCVLDNKGKMTEATKESLQILLADIIMYHGLTTDDIFRHYDLTTKKKKCHRWYVDNENDWLLLKLYVNAQVAMSVMDMPHA